MRTTLMALLAAILAANGLFMLADPAAWYAAVPGVTGTGPLNPHFVRDIGCAYLIAGGGLIWATYDARAWPGAVVSASFLTLHGLVHLWDGFAGREAPGLLLLHDGQVVQTVAVEPTENGLIGAIYTVRNPEKLRHIS